MVAKHGLNSGATLMVTDDREHTSEGEDPIEIPVEDSLDLHTFSPNDIKALVEEYLLQCLQRGFKEVRIIHGRGKGVQRHIVREILQKSPCVLGFRDAPPQAGGWGATLVQLIDR